MRTLKKSVGVKPVMGLTDVRSKTVSFSIDGVRYEFPWDEMPFTMNDMMADEDLILEHPCAISTKP